MSNNNEDKDYHCSDGQKMAIGNKEEHAYLFVHILIQLLLSLLKKANLHNTIVLQKRKNVECQKI